MGVIVELQDLGDARQRYADERLAGRDTGVDAGEHVGGVLGAGQVDLHRGTPDVPADGR